MIGNDEQARARVEMIQMMAEGVADGGEGRVELNGKLLDPREGERQNRAVTPMVKSPSHQLDLCFKQQMKHNGFRGAEIKNVF